MSSLWIVVICTSAFAFILKFIGHSVPEQILNRPRLTLVNRYIPIALLAALVAVQAFAIKSALTIDHRAAGLFAALLALKFKAPYPLVVFVAALTSALIVNLF